MASDHEGGRRAFVIVRQSPEGEQIGSIDLFAGVAAGILLEPLSKLTGQAQRQCTI